MPTFSLDRIVQHAAAMPASVAWLWTGLATLTVALFILSRTRWGQNRPLRKCLVLSLLAHLLMMGYATTVQIVAGQPAREPEPVVHISLDDGNPWEDRLPEAGVESPTPWASHHHASAMAPESVEVERAEIHEQDNTKRTSRAPKFAPPSPKPMSTAGMPSPVQAEPDSPDAEIAETDTASHTPAAAIDAPAPEKRAAPDVELPKPVQQRAPSMVAAHDTPPSRPTSDGLANSLLEQRVPLQRMTDLPIVDEPRPLLAGAEDAPAASAMAAVTDLAEADSTSESSSTDRANSSAAAATSVARKHPAAATTAPLPGLAKLAPPEAGAELVGAPVLGKIARPQESEEVPQVYRLRVAPNRSEIALRHGATHETEAAVRAALKWLADNQEADGRWSPQRHAGGDERRVHGRDRFGAGARADTGISALALLAFLASGHTHQEGLYRENVQRGLEFLLRSQGNDGNLGGEASTYAFMYCHGMATFAVSEAYGMTGDRRLEGPVRRAVMYTVTAQNPSTGGWRYKPGDEGDTSQLGWQLMALKSAELAGIPMPAHTRAGAIRYLDSVSSGRYGGLAAYRPVEQPSRTMTAEALACRHFLGLPPGSLAGHEAAEYLLGEPPGDGQANLYYWYYATLGLYQRQGDQWDRWNAALQRELLARQRNSGTAAGSWDPDTVWGGYGGRVYSTALATLCLEVYYRFMPLYVEAASVGRTYR